MSDPACRNVEITDWSKVRKDIEKVNPELAQIIDMISPDKKLKLIKATYLFGDLMVKDGNLQLPTQKGDLALISHPDINKTLLPLVRYSQIPLTILLNKASEIFVKDDAHVVPLKFFIPGNIFGTFEVLNTLLNLPSFSPWNVSAGSRSIFLLPRISEAGGFKRLKQHFDLRTDPPRSMSDHWDLFKQIANHSNFKQPWKSEVVIFTADWFSSNYATDPCWQAFRLFLFREGWLQNQGIFKKEQLSWLWRKLVDLIMKRRLSPSPYLIDTLKHLFLICVGEMPAFQPITSFDLSVPHNEIQNVLVEIYNLKKYIPTLMHVTSYTNFHQNLPLYYSLALPTLLEGVPDKKYRSSTLMYDLKDLKILIETLFKNDSLIEESVLKGMQFDFFHSQNEKDSSIKLSSLIFQEDPRFKDSRFLTEEFCSTSPFWRGCIRIRKNLS